MPIFLTTVEARDGFSTVVDRAAYGNERIVVTRHGEPMAAIVPLADLELLEDVERRLGQRRQRPTQPPRPHLDADARRREQIKLWEVG